MVHERHRKLVLLYQSIQLLLVIANSSCGDMTQQDKLVSLIRHQHNTFFFKHTLNMTHPNTLSNGINNCKIETLDDLILNYLLHGRIFTFLGLDTKLVIRHKLYFVRINIGRNFNYVHSSTRDSSLKPL